MLSKQEEKRFLKLKVLGIITEYNPFHNGHIIHIKKSMKVTNADYCIAVMSGNHVERGEPAICDKYIRTEIALKNGVDLVIELPFIYAASSAEYFAYNSVAILEKTGLVDYLCFGSEGGDIKGLSSVARLLSDEPEYFKSKLKAELSKGLSYPAARYNALKNSVCEDISFLASPNNILAVEYLKALVKLNSSIQPFTIDRSDTPYHSENIDSMVASATAIRKAIFQNRNESALKAMPYNEKLNEIILSENYGHINKYSDLFHYSLLNTNLKKLSNIFDVDEGLENRIMKYASENYNISDIVEKIKTKRYTFTKIQRMILHILFDIRKNDFLECNQAGGAQYIRVLGFRRESRGLLTEMTKKASLPVFTNLKDANLSAKGSFMLDKELYTSGIYYLSMFKSPAKNIEYSKPVIIV